MHKSSMHTNKKFSTSNTPPFFRKLQGSIFFSFFPQFEHAHMGLRDEAQLQTIVEELDSSRLLRARHVGVMG